MKKKFRIKKNSDFKKIISRKKMLVDPNFTFYFLNNKIDHMRVGFSVSKKIGNAVVRNKIKRQLRMMAQRHLDLNKSIDLIIMCRPNYLDYTFLNIENNFIKLSNKLNKEN